MGRGSPGGAPNSARARSARCRVSRSASVGRPLDRALVQYLRDFVATESASGVLLVVAAAAALIWANISMSSYETTWATPLHLDLLRLDLDLRDWINDAAMALFFFVV